MNKDLLYDALSNWRKIRDKYFEAYGLDVEEVYTKGDFLNLPPKCLMAVCYVDAYNCAIEMVEH